MGRATRVCGAPNVPNTELPYGFFPSGLHSSNKRQYCESFGCNFGLGWGGGVGGERPVLMPL